MDDEEDKMARLGLDAGRFAKGDPRDLNHFHAIIGTDWRGEVAIGSLSLFSDGTASVRDDVAGRVVAFDNHADATAYALAM